MKPVISIITAVRDQIEYNRLFMASIAKTTELPWELIIVDNGSTDGSADFFEKSGAVVLRNGSNRCYGCSQNQGIAAAQGDYFAFLNNDMILSQGWDRALVTILDTWNFEVISPFGCETRESDAAISKALRRWKRVNLMQRLRNRFAIPYTHHTLEKIVARMYRGFDRFASKRAESMKGYIYPGISGFAVLCRRSLMTRLGGWPTEVTASDFALRALLVKEMTTTGHPVQPVITGDVAVHHFARVTTKRTRVPWQCTHPFTPLDTWMSADNTQFLKEPSISVIIAVYNKPDFLRKVLLSLVNQTFTDFEVVIADDGSGPEIATTAASFEKTFPYPIQHVWHDDNGFRKTIIANRAVSRARARLLVFIDGDSILHSRFLEEHWKARKSGVINSGRRVMLTEQGTAILTDSDIATRRIESVKFLAEISDAQSMKHSRVIPWLVPLEQMIRAGRNYHILGANFSMHTGDFYRLNGYEESVVGRGMEDDNLANRAKMKGLHIRSIARSAVQYHLHHTSAPIPHSRESIDKWGWPPSSQAVIGMQQLHARFSAEDS